MTQNRCLVQIDSKFDGLEAIERATRTYRHFIKKPFFSSGYLQTDISTDNSKWIFVQSKLSLYYIVRVSK